MGKPVRYCDGRQPLEGYLAAPPSAVDLPGVVIAPSWLNVTESICRRADQIAELGFAAFVLDVLGAGIRPEPPQLPLQVIKPFLDDRLFFRRRLIAGMEAFYRQPECSPGSVAAIGYCLGGCGVLELARSGANLRGVVSLHGMLNSSLAARPGAIRSKILVLHGDEDPIVSMEEVMAFRKEMRLARANWEIVLYGDAKHSFTGEGVAGSPEAGLDPQSEDRSWRATIAFLDEVLKKPRTESRE
jgi:dienelactone hydrolase